MTGRRVSRSATFHTAESARAVIVSFQLSRVARSSATSWRPFAVARVLASANRSTMGVASPLRYAVCGMR
ncbi:hypothetical protein BH09ACT8_BH09ACT8_45390 [soil metagenome]